MIDPDSVEFLPLSQGYKALVDKDVFERVKKYKWHVAFRGTRVYAQRSTYVNRKVNAVYLHSDVLPKMDGFYVDHINPQTPFCVLDERRSNLRYVTNTQNNHNKRKGGSSNPNRKSPTSKFKGVYKSALGPKWVAQITANGLKRSLGNYESEEEAAKAYDRAARMHFGDFAKTNFK